MLDEISVQGWLDAVAAQSATPGGGSCTALIGALAAALVAMVCRLTLARVGPAGPPGARLSEALERAEVLRAQLTALAGADVAAFDAVMQAYALPRASEAEQERRRAAIQSGLRQATLVPLECARACGEVLGLSAIVSEEGQLSALGESGVAAEAARAALRASVLNVSINLGSIHDQAFVDAQRLELDRISDRYRHLEQRIEAHIAQRLGRAPGGPAGPQPLGGHSIGHS